MTGGVQRFQLDDFWDQVNADGPCWLWTGDQQQTIAGYVQLSWKCLPEPTIHRAVWRLLVGDIPDGMELDHLCRVRHCCNPDHVELVTHDENMRRKANRGYCNQGHAMTPDNVVSNGARPICKRCRREYRRRLRASRTERT